ncbi:MAG: hypothetical protein KJ774_09610 [Firmicutes bacterium]|nr:hypothetical protein [Bacillota bacterium]
MVYLYVTPIPENITEDNWFEISYHHIKNCSKLSLHGTSTYNVMIDVENIRAGNYFNYSYIYTKLLHNLGTTCFKKPKGIYLKSFCKGDWEDSPRTYQNISDYADKHGLVMTGYAYEQIVLDEAATNDHKNYVSEISIRID